jgi:predicted metal-dependent phosphoesterase TrpH
MRKIADLHIHSNFSDGDYSVEELIDKIKNANISLFSITDHDEFGACVKIVKENLVPEGLSFINGIEFTTIWNDVKVHILGYGMNVDDDNFLSEIKKMVDMRKEKIVKLVDFLKEKYNIIITQTEIKNLYRKKNVLGKPDIAKILVERNLATSVYDAIDKYLSHFSHPESKVKSDEAIRVIKNANGISVLAHPQIIVDKEKYNYQEIFDFISDLKDRGLDGIEVYYGQHTNEDIDKFNQIAEMLDLIASSGSDYHGKITKPYVKLGKVTLEDRENIKISSIFVKKGVIR